MIVFNNLTSTIAKFKPLNKELKIGSLIKIEGDNGSGKTCLINILAGLSQNYTGNITINNYDLKYNVAEFQSNLQTVFAQNGLYDDLSVQDNIKLWSKRWSQTDLTNAAIDVFELQKFRNFTTKKLSSGLKRRVALARLIACPAKIWIIDEADSYLDSKSLAILKDVIIQRIKNQGTVFFTAHSDYLEDIINSRIIINR